MKKKKSVWFMMVAILMGFIPPILTACSSIAHAIEIQPDKIVDQAGLKVISSYDVSAYNDPFKYTADGGQYPSHGTNQYTNSNSSDMIKNYNYGSKGDTDSKVEIQNILNGNLTFDNGYHDYGNAFLKKTVSPTDEKDKFKIQLDVLSGVEQVDIVLVLDKSSSMKNASRNDNMVKAVREFADEVLPDGNAGNIRIAVTNFWGNSDVTSNTKSDSIQSEVSKFSNNISFSSNRDDIKNSKVLTRAPVSGTPITMGIKAGNDVLYNNGYEYGANPDAKKIMILLTDGAPYTAIQKDYYYDSVTRTTASDGNNYRIYYDQSKIDNNGKRFWMNSTPTGTGDRATGVRNDTIGFANYIKDQTNMDVYTIGFGIGKDKDSDPEYSSENSIARWLLKQIATSKKQYFLAEDGLDEIVQVFKDIAESLKSPIRNGVLTDPMSEFVDLQGNVTMSALQVENGSMQVIKSTDSNYPEFAKEIVSEQDGNTLIFSEITMGRTLDRLDGIRIEYEITLKDEYHDGSFYPANDDTKLVNKNSDAYYFAVPSIKVAKPEFDLEVEKIWNDDENVWSSRQDIVLQLQQKNGDSDWTDVSDKRIIIGKDAVDEKLKAKFEELPAYDDKQNEIVYRIIETRVNGYGDPTYSQDAVTMTSENKLIQVTNKLLKTPIAFMKVGNDGKTPLANAGFTLYKADGTTAIGKEVKSDVNGKVTFDTELPIGKYVIKETTTPMGYQTQDPIEITITDKDGELTVSGIKDNKVVNLLKDFDLIVTKKDNHGKDLKGAKFKLVGKDYSKELDSDTNVFTFTGLKPGEYELTETVAPDGYVGLKDSIKIVIDQDGKVTIDGKEQKDVITTDGNVIKYNVANQQKGLLPSTGGQGIRHLMEFALLVIGLSALVGGIYVYRNRKELN